MIRNSIIILVFALCNNVIAQKEIIENDSLLLWQVTRKLTWNDFKGTPKENPINEVANIKGSIVVTISDWLEDIPKFNVRCFFKKYESWNIVTDSLSLKHEQGHFDIDEIYARKIRKSFDSLNQNRIANIKKYELTHKKLINECENLNNLYEESNFNEKVQQEWTVKIAKELENLKVYEYNPKE